MKRAPNLKYQPRDKMTEVIIFAGSDAGAMQKNGMNGQVSILQQMIHHQSFWVRNNWKTRMICKLSMKAVIMCVFIVPERLQRKV